MQSRQKVPQLAEKYMHILIQFVVYKRWVKSSWKKFFWPNSYNVYQQGNKLKKENTRLTFQNSWELWEKTSRHQWTGPETHTYCTIPKIWCCIQNTLVVLLCPRLQWLVNFHYFTFVHQLEKIDIETTLSVKSISGYHVGSTIKIDFLSVKGA